MKKTILATTLGLFTLLVNGQTLETQYVSDWSTLRESGFYESSTNSLNSPNNLYDFFWGINMAHSTNKFVTGEPYHWGGQIAMPINRFGLNSVPQMYIRSIEQTGKGKWAKVITDLGDQNINGGLFLNGDFQLPLNRQIGMNISDSFNYNGINLGHYSLQWLIDPKIPGAGTLWLSSCAGIKFFTEGKMRMAIHSNGNVGIGTENPQNKLDVAGTIRAQEIKVELTGWADYVFDKEYSLPSLQEVKAHIEEHKHLPGIPSEKQVLEEGVNMGEMQAKLLQKIEELTLYTIQLEERIKELENK